MAVGARIFLGPYIADDAYITFRYSQNLAAGHGFVYNLGERVQGTTAPLFTILMAGAAAIRLDLAWASLAVNAAADLVTILCGAALLTRAGWPIAALLYGTALAFWPAFITYSVSGLETSTYVALLTASCYLADSGRSALTGVAIGLAALCRPDGALLGALAIGFLLWRHGLAAARNAVTAGALTVLPWALFAFGYFHTLIPATIAAKAHTRLSAGESLAAFQARFWSGMYVLITPLAIAGAAALATRARPVFLPMALWWMGYCGVFIVTGAFGPYPWYFVPTLPIYLACAASAVEYAARRVFRASLLERLTPLAIVPAALLLGSRLPPLRATLDQWFSGREYLYRDVAQQVLHDQSCALAATEIGALGYYYRGPVLDFVGLVSPEVTRRPLPDVLDAVRPCWIVSYDTHLDAAFTSAPAFAENYTIAFRRRVGPERELLVFRRR
jgi:hypothetical protein